jgi:hypothetical protein
MDIFWRMIENEPSPMADVVAQTCARPCRLITLPRRDVMKGGH